MKKQLKVPEYLLVTGLVFLLIVFAAAQIKRVPHTPNEEYVCLPCGNTCDNTVYDQPGTCPVCHLVLVKKSSITFKTIRPSQICAFIKANPDVLLIDVRTREEYEGKTDSYGTLQHAINIPVSDLEKRLPMMGSMKHRQIIVYCSHSHRSPQAAYMLTQHGFSDVSNMSGGMSTMEDNSCKR